MPASWPGVSTRDFWEKKTNHPKTTKSPPGKTKTNIPRNGILGGWTGINGSPRINRKNLAKSRLPKNTMFFWWHVFVEMYSLGGPKKNVDFGILEFLKTTVFCFQNKKNRMKRHMKCSPPPGEWFDFLELGQFVEIPKPYTPKKCFSHVSFQCVKRNWTQAMPVSKPMPSC